MAVDFINALGAGSGIDSNKLASDLVEAVRAPQKAILDGKIAKEEARISGYGVVQYSLSAIRTAFTALKDAASFNAIQVNNSQSEAFNVTISAEAAPGVHRIEVLSVVAAQRSVSNGFSSAQSVIGAGSLNLTLTIGGNSSVIPVANATPRSVVDAINAADAGVSATLVDTGGANPWRIVVEGSAGADNAFTLTSDDGVNALDLSEVLDSASDARVRVDGLLYQRPTNSIDDVIEGGTLDLVGATTGVARVGLVRNTAMLTSKLQDLVTAYTDFESSVDILRDPKSEVDQYGGTLVGDMTVQRLRTQVESMLRAVFDANGTIRSARDVGLTTGGTISLDEQAWNEALTENFTEVMQLFAGTDAAPGIADSAVEQLDELLDPTRGLVAQQENGADSRIIGYKDQLDRLQAQMDQLLKRYTLQFSLMESIVGNANTLRTNLKSTFEGLAAMYTDK